jgi:DNA-binding NarL/FixJ family response regulator
MALSKEHGFTESAYANTRVLRRAISSVIPDQSPVAPKRLASRVKGLSQAQFQMLRARASGQTRKQIAYALGVSLKTIEYHFSRIYRCLGIGDDIELTHYAIRNGLIEVKGFGHAHLE